MKIRRLDLLRFGPFTDVTLSFDCVTNGLHVVCGPNEAGKSSALRALRQLLYGIPHNSADNFLHPHTNLRIGALLESAGGQILECIRRKGRAKTLRDGDDAEVLDPACLEQMLGGIDETTFSQRFGIDYDELRKGGEAVVQGGGDLGEILFAAGAGVADLRFVQQRLADEADELFKPRGSLQHINQALSELGAARRAMKEAQLPISKWVEHDKALRKAETRKARIDDELLSLRTRQSRFERIEKALPLLARRVRLETQLAEVAGAPLLPEGFSGQRSKAVTELAAAQRTEREATVTIEKLQSMIAGLNLPAGLLEHRTAISGLHTGLGSYQKAAQDRPGLVARMESAEQQARKILADLGRAPELEHAEQLRLNRTQRERIQSLASDCKVRIDKQSSAERALRKLRHEIEQLESELAELPDGKDVGPLNRTIRHARKHGDLDQQRADTRDALRVLERQAEVDLKKLRLFNGTLQQLEQLPVPALETVEVFENEIADAASAANRIEERIGQLRQQVQKIEQSLEKLRLEHDVPSEEDLIRARRQRDDGWQLVRQSWPTGEWPTGETPSDDSVTSEFVGKFAPGGDLAAAFQASVEAADAVGDRLRREADRVAEKARLTADRQDLDRQLDEHQQSLVTAREALQRLKSQWQDQWTAVDIDPLSPREMRAWLSQQKALASVGEAIRQHQCAVEAADALVNALQVELSDCLLPLGQSIPTRFDSFTRMLEHCESAAEAIEISTRQRQQCEKNLKKLSDELSEAEYNAEQAAADSEKWRVEWAEAVSALGLERDTAPSEANSVIGSVDDLFGFIKEASAMRDRIDGIDRDADAFGQSVRRLLAQIAEDLLELPVDQAVADLNDRLSVASTAYAKLAGWQEQLETEKSKRDAAESTISQLLATIDAMCRQANCASPQDLPSAEDRSARRHEIEKDLHNVREQLDDLAAGESLEALLAEAEQFDPDQLQADLQSLGEDIAELEREKSEVAESIGSERSELRRMDGSGLAAAAQEQTEHLLARIRSDAEQYIRLRTASVVLQKSIERFREQNQGPVLQRANELFSELTLGSFAGLRADYNDKGDAVLVGVRSDGQRTVGVEGMSDGTCDQLYLALRLALLESYLTRAEPMPLVVDDILIKFDDDRAVAALKSLVHLAERTQVIFFTHHHHLVQLAKENLDEDMLFIHEFHQPVCHGAEL